MASSNLLGFADQSASSSEEQNIAFYVSMFAKKHIFTSLPCKIVEVDTENQQVTVQIISDEVFADGTAQERAPLYEVPYMQIMAGNVLIKITPQKDDVGVVIFACRDISRLKKDWKHNSPETVRTHHMSDAMYSPSIFKASSDAKHILEIDQENGFTFSSDKPVVMKADLTVEGNAIFKKDLQVKGQITAQGNITSEKGDVIASGISLMNHIHPTSQSGQPTGKPQ